MRLLVLFMFCCVGWANATISYAQKAVINLNVRNANVEEVLKEIEHQSDFGFFYNNHQIDLKRKVSVKMNNANIFAVLNEVFKGTDIECTVLDKKIVLSNLATTQKTAKNAAVRITGRVIDASGEPIIGASVIESGTTNGTITDLDGKFILNVSSPDATIEITYIGYKKETLKVVAGKPMAITLKDDTRVLDEVVVVGFGSQKKANLTGAVSSVKMDEVIGNRPILNAADALQSTVPGLLVSNGGNDPGKSKSFQIRGAYSLGIQNSDGTMGNAIRPLVLIDNVEGDIDMINPEDIETVTVMKDAASAAIFGARAAGGVILVTTKRPKGATNFQLNYNNNFGFGNAVNLPKQAPLADYLRAYSDAAGDQFWSMGSPSINKWLNYLDEYKKDPSKFNTVGDGIFKDTDGAVYYLNEKDLVGNMITNSFQMTHNISASGGTEKLRYRLSGGFVSNDGVLITDKDKFTRFNFSSFIAADITPWFTQEATVSYGKSKKTLPSSSLGAIYSTRLVSFYPEGIIPGDISSTGKDLPSFTGRNQVLWANTSKDLNDNPRIFLKSILKPVKGLEVAFEYTFDKNVYDYSWYTGKTSYTTIQGGENKTPTDDYLRKYKQYTDYNAINIYGTYNLNIGQHKFRLMGGFNQESNYSETLDASSYGQAIIEVPSMDAGTSKIVANDSYSEYAVRGGFFRVNYSYLDKYLLEVNGRYDGSSRFPKNNRFGFFPSVSAGWQVAQEKFMDFSRKWLDGFKLRASYGRIGNQSVANYAYIPSMDIDNKYKKWLINGDYVTAISGLPKLVSQNFTWEKVGTLDLGVDITLFNNRLNGTFDWFQRDTKGMLAPGMDLPAVVGTGAPLQNTADMRTRGWEVSVNWRDKIGKVGYRLGLNLSDGQSEIVRYDDNKSKVLESNNKELFYEGKKLGEIWGYVADGFYTVDDFESTSTWILKEGVAKIDGVNPRPGDLKFQNLRDDDKGENLIYGGDNTASNPGDRKIIGNTTPRYLYGINLGVNYGGFDLSVFMQGTGKRDAWLANTLTFPLYSDFKFIPLYDGLSDYWKPADKDNGDYTALNPNARFPRIYGDYGNMGSNYRKSDRFLSNASYFRIKNVTLSYIVPQKWISKLMLKQLKGFISVENLATFSSLPSGIDPETLEWNYPSYRTISFGLNFTL
ncbi:MAG: TonB-dependent receptor [Bacteroides sp.]